MQTIPTLAGLLARPRLIGTWTQIASADLIDMLGRAGYDFTIIDCEHGAFGIETAESLIRACEAADVAPLVRVPRLAYGGELCLYKALDAGAIGVLVPGIESAEDAARAVAAGCFAPQGARGACPIVRGAAHSALGWSEFARAQSRNGVIAMIETAAGIAAAEAICATPGLMAVMAGPFDLAVSMGFEGNHRHPEVQAALQRLVAAANAHEVPLFVPVFAPERDALCAQIDQWTAAGVRRFAIGADKIIAAAAFARYRQWADEGEVTRAAMKSISPGSALSTGKT
jgi:4-hydroxy-2-oxoheptanedioate aldolase